MRQLIVHALAMCACAASALGQTPEAKDSVVRIHASIVLPNWYEPWTSYSVDETKGTGVVIDGERILTNAHVVAYAEEILIESEALPRRVPATVEFLDEGVDLAVLTVDAPGFFDLHAPVEFSRELPDDGDPVVVLGFPMGGETMSATTGVVSRVEWDALYFHEAGVRVQIDAAVNPGNSGGPAFVDERCIGIVFSHIEEGENIGYVISTIEIERFLDDIADGALDGKPYLDLDLGTTENPGRRAWLGLRVDDTGVTVLSAAEPTGLQRWDVITAVGGRALDDQGYGEVQGKRLRWGALVDREIAPDGTVPLSIIRGGERLEIRARATPERDDLYLYTDEMRPEYFVHGPFVFTAATGHYARLADGGPWGISLAYRRNPLATRRYDRRAFEDEEIVVISTRPFPHPILRGHDRIDLGSALKSVNGVEVRNLRHAYALMKGNTEAFIQLEFVDDPADGLDALDRLITVDAAELEAATETLLRRHSIREAASESLRED
jgi:S1-C subfamily serine protease